MQTHHWPAQQRVHSGTGALETALPAELASLGWERVMLVTPNSLRGGELASLVTRLIGQRLKVTVAGIPAHSPIDSVAKLVAQCQQHEINGIVALGGGSVIDACKAALLALGEHIDASVLTAQALVRASHYRLSDWSTEPRPRMIAIPTTLSAAEFTSFGGITDTATERKVSVGHPSVIPIVVIHDPINTISTPVPLLLSTGARSVDHSIEGFCSVSSTPMSDATAVEAARLLFSSLPQLHDDPANLSARRDAQAAAWLSIQGRANGVAHGASHGIGYILGAAFGVPHGVTSCVALPAVLRWNAAANRDRQAEFSRRLDLDPDIALADYVEALFSSLDLPTKLSQVGVNRDQFDKLAGLYDGKGPISTNPRPIYGVAQLHEILELAA